LHSLNLPLCFVIIIGLLRSYLIIVSNADARAAKRVRKLRIKRIQIVNCLFEKVGIVLKMANPCIATITQ